MPSEEVARSWVRIARDSACVAVGAFMLIYETAFAHDPNAYIIGGGLTALGLPSAIRLDLRRKDGGGG